MDKGKRAALTVFILSIILCSLLLSSCKSDQTLEKPYFETVEAGWGRIYSNISGWMRVFSKERKWDGHSNIRV